MIYKTIFSIATTAVLVASCSKTENIKPTYLEEDSAASKTTNTTTIASTSNPSLVNQTINPEEGNTSVVNSVNPSASGKNPAHGQPGHRCDIPVGAPLSTPIQNNAQNIPNTNTQQVKVNPTPLKPDPAANAVQQNQKVAPGMNPPHGQPGHRCDIPVGQSLKSAPAPKQNVATPNIVSQNNIPATVASPKSPEVKLPAGSINPAHGKPGHRCDTPVGQPLVDK